MQKTAGGRLSRFDVLNLVIGSIIGLGSFILPGTSFLPKSGVLNTALGIVAGAICIVIIQKAYQVMLARHVGEGGEFSYTLANLGKVHGFIVGWSLALCYLSLIPLNATAYVLILRRIFGHAVMRGYLYRFAQTEVYIADIIIASLPIVIFTIINLRGISLSSKVQDVMSFALVAIVVALFVVVLAKSDISRFAETYLGLEKLSLVQAARVLAISPFLFVGFDVVPQLSTDLGFEPARTHRTTILAIAFGALLYNLLNLIAALSYGPEEARQVEWAVAGSVLEKAGAIGFAFMLLALFSAVTGGINGFMISSAKLLGSLSREKLCPAFLGEKNEKNLYPKALIFIMIVSLIGPWVGRSVIVIIVDMTSVLAALAYTYVSFIGIRAANTKGEKAACSASFVIGLCFIALLLIPGSPARLSTAAMSALAAWALLGVLFYRFGIRRQSAFD